MLLRLCRPASLQALLPVPAQQDLPPRLAALWSRSFSSACWMTLFEVRALSHCTLMVLDREAARQVVQEYGWVSESACVQGDKWHSRC